MKQQKKDDSGDRISNNKERDRERGIKERDLWDPL